MSNRDFFAAMSATTTMSPVVRPTPPPAYGTRSPVRMLNVVVARTDGTAIGDVRLGAPPFTDYGDVRCTRTIQVAGQTTPARASDTMLLCFRAERDLTVSVLALGVTPDGDGGVAAAVDDLWARQG